MQDFKQVLDLTCKQCWAPQIYTLFRNSKFCKIAMGGPQACGNFLHLCNRKWRFTSANFDVILSWFDK